MSRSVIHLSSGSDAAKTVLALREAEFEVVVVNTSTEYRLDAFDFAPAPAPVAANLYEHFLSRRMAVARYAFPWLGPLGGLFLRATGAEAALGRAVEARGGVEFIFAHWGSGITPEIALVRGARAFAHVPVILNLETFPTDWRGGARGRFESALLRRAAQLVDGVILASDEMVELVEHAAPELLRKPTLVAPFYFPRSFTATADPPAIPAAPGDDVVFTGWADPSYSLNDVRPQLLDLARAGLTVHCSPTPDLAHANLRIFERFKLKAFTSGAFASFMRKFRASLVTFNAAPGDPSLQRFRTSLPTRLLFSLAVGVPVLLPSARLPASERLLAANQTGLVYERADEAREHLLAPDWADAQRRAYALRDRFTFDRAAFLAFVARVLAGC